MAVVIKFSIYIYIYMSAFHEIGKFRRVKFDTALYEHIIADRHENAMEREVYYWKLC